MYVFFQLFKIFFVLDFQKNFIQCFIYYFHSIFFDFFSHDVFFYFIYNFFVFFFKKFFRTLNFEKKILFNS